MISKNKVIKKNLQKLLHQLKQKQHHNKQPPPSGDHLEISQSERVLELRQTTEAAVLRCSTK